MSEQAREGVSEGVREGGRDRRTNDSIVPFTLQKSWTALMYAVSGSRPKVVKELLLAGADPTDKDKVCIPLIL